MKIRSYHLFSASYKIKLKFFSKSFWVVIDATIFNLTRFYNLILSHLFSDCQIISPLPYAIGNQAEEIKFHALLCAINEKKPVILFPAHHLQRLLQYKQCNLSLSSACQNYSKEMIGSVKYNSIWLIFNVIFIVQRFTYLLVGKYIIKRINILSGNNVSGLSYYWSFPRIGIDNLWKELSIHTIDDINSKRLQLLQRLLNASIEKIFHKSIFSTCSHLNDLFSGEIIIFHVRSSVYHNDANRRNRNSNVNNFINSLESLSMKTASKVIIIGDRNSLDFTIRNSIINLPNLLKDESLRRVLELELIRKCFLYIGTQSGPMDVANLLSKPTILFNCIDLSTASGHLWSEQLMFTKPPKLNTTIEAWIEAYFCDLNGDYQGEDFECHSSTNFIATALCEVKAMIPELKRLNRDYYNNTSHFSHRQLNSIKTIATMVPNRTIDRFINDLVRNWEDRAAASPFSSFSSYLRDEILRLCIKNKFSNLSKGYAFIDSENISVSKTS